MKFFTKFGRFETISKLSFYYREKDDTIMIFCPKNYFTFYAVK